MKNHIKIVVTALTLTMLLTVASCDKTQEETEAEMTALETVVTETTAETTETTVETTAEETEVTEETEETEVTLAFDEQEFDADEYPFDISVDTFVEASNEVGATVYYDVDEYISLARSIQSSDSPAVAQIQEGIAYVTDGAGVVALSNEFDDELGIEFEEFDSHITTQCGFIAADPALGGYDVSVMYYEVDDPEVLADWYDDVATRYGYIAPSSNPDTDMFTVSVAAYRSGDARALLTSSVFTESALQDYGYSDQSGAFVAVYAQGTSGLFIGVSDLSDDATGLSMLNAFCEAMGIMNPATIAAAE